MSHKEESKLLKGLGIGACVGATLASTGIPVLQNVAYGQELDSGGQSVSSEQRSSSSATETSVPIASSTAPSVSSEQPVASVEAPPAVDTGNAGSQGSSAETPQSSAQTGTDGGSSSSSQNSSTNSSDTSSSTTNSTGSSSSSSSSSSNSTNSSSSSSSSNSSSQTHSSSSTVKPAPTPSKPANRPASNGNTATSNNNVAGATNGQAAQNDSATNTGGSSAEPDYHFTKNQTTQEFITKIGEDAREVAAKNDLYASVMIAQAILESASGNSTLAREPNHNLFGIKGSFAGQSVTMSTQEDNGSGSMYTIQSAFRKYPSYKDSLNDYAKLLKGGTDYLSSFYSGTWRSRTESYKDATAYLTGRYATDTAYNKKLNALIETYNLAQYDEAAAGSATEATAEPLTITVQQPDIIHIVEPGDTLWDLSQQYEVSIEDLAHNNGLTSSLIYVGQQLIIKKGEQVVQTVATETKSSEEDLKEKQVDLSEKASEVIYSIGQGLSAALDSEKDTKSSLLYKVNGKIAFGANYQSVSEGDSLKTIAARYNIPVKKLAEWNQTEDKILTVGQKLIVSLPYIINS